MTTLFEGFYRTYEGLKLVFNDDQFVDTYEKFLSYL